MSLSDLLTFLQFKRIQNYIKMNAFLPEIDDLIAKVLTDEATTEDMEELSQWLDAAPENRQYFDDLKRLWSESATALPSEYSGSVVVDTDAAWAIVQKRINTPKHLIIKWLYIGNILKIAAAIAFLITAFLFFNEKNKPIQNNYVAELDIKTETLLDGSVITLNKKSSVSTTFSKKERRVKMAGEAYFAVAHDTEKPFVIEVKTLEVKVVGTAFNIDNLSQPNQIIVVVEEGIVEVKGQKEMLRLTKGQKAVYNILTGSFNKSDNTDKNVTAYKTGRLDFESTKLKDVVNKINNLFGHNIEIASPALENCEITTVYEGQDLEFFFKEIIGESIKIEVEKQGDRIILRGKGCEN